MNIISECKKFFCFVLWAVELIRKNLFLSARLVFLSGASMVGGVALTPLLPFFNEAKRNAYWYLDINYLIAFGTLLVSGVFICYLIIHILEKQTVSEIKSEMKIKQAEAEKEQAEREKEATEKMMHGDPPAREEKWVERIFHDKKEKLRIPFLRHETPLIEYDNKKEDE